MRATSEGKKLMLRLQDIRNRKAELEVVERSVEFELRELLRAAPDKKFEYEDLSAMYIQSSKVRYELDKLEETFPRDVLKQLVDEEYVVDKKAMRELFSEYPKMKNRIGKTLKKVASVNNKKVEAAHATGIVSLEELKKCCTIQMTEYTRMVRKDKA